MTLHGKLVTAGRTQTLSKNNVRDWRAVVHLVPRSLETKSDGKCEGDVELLIKKTHNKATKRHLPYGITECYLLPNVHR